MAMTGKTQEELLTEELWSAAEQGDLQEVRKRSEYGAADMTLFDENHHNTLWYGVKSGNADLVKYLVERIGLIISSDFTYKSAISVFLLNHFSFLRSREVFLRLPRTALLCSP